MNRMIVLLLLIVCHGAGCYRHDGVREFNDYLETGKLRTAYGQPEVEITIGARLLWLGGLLAGEARHATNPLTGVDQVRIVVYRLQRGPEPALQALLDLAGTLESRGWDSVVSINGDPEQARVMVKTGTDGIRGVMVMAVDPGDEAVFINISGAIRPEQIGDITRRWTPKWVFEQG
jgi:hypothetical protein